MIVIVMGVSGCGKTTVGKLLAESLGWSFSDADNFHPTENIEKMSSGVPLSDDDRKPWLEAMRRAIASWLDQGEDIVLACSALKQRYRDVLRVDSERVKFVYLKGSWEAIRRRLDKRSDHFMKAGLLASQFEALEEPADAIEVDVQAMPEQAVDRIRQELAL